MPPTRIGRVFVGVDGTPGSLHALRRAVDLARAFDAPLVPVLAWQAPGGEAPSAVPAVPELELEWTRNAEQRLTTAFAQGLGALPADLRCEPHIVRGAAGPVLVGLADRADDLLVIGTGRHGLLARFTHSRIARYCVAHAACSVVAVPPPPLAGLRHRFRRSRLKL